MKYIVNIKCRMGLFVQNNVLNSYLSNKGLQSAMDNFKARLKQHYDCSPESKLV